MWGLVVVAGWLVAVSAAAQQAAELQLLRVEDSPEFPSLRLLVYGDAVARGSVDRLQIRLRDESPDDGVWGAALFGWDLRITGTDGRN